MASAVGLTLLFMGLYFQAEKARALAVVPGNEASTNFRLQK
jgi:hypothetical protein